MKRLLAFAARSRVRLALGLASGLLPVLGMALAFLSSGEGGEIPPRVIDVLMAILIVNVLCMAVLMVTRPAHYAPWGVPERITAIRGFMDMTGRLLAELEDELRTRTELLEELQREADRYERLASLNAEQAQVIEDLVRRQFARQSKLTWVQWTISIVVAFALGLVVNWISAPALAWFTGLWS